MSKKELARLAYIEGYLRGYGVEEPSSINERTAERRFEKCGERNHE